MVTRDWLITCPVSPGYTQAAMLPCTSLSIFYSSGHTAPRPPVRPLLRAPLPDFQHPATSVPGPPMTDNSPPGAGSGRS